MSFLTVIYAVVFYVAGATLIGGLGYKVWRYAHTPAPLKIPTTPAPTTRHGVAWAVVQGGGVFHQPLQSLQVDLAVWLAVPCRAACRTAGPSSVYHRARVGWVVVLQSLGLYAALAMIAGLAGLALRRVIVDRVRYISAPSDHLMLVLLLGIAVSGFLMRTVARTDMVQLKMFVLGLISFDWQPLPGDGVLITHLTLVVILMLIFPFSKLLHAPGVFFSPTLNQVDNPRERRHLAAWAASLETEHDSGGV